MANIVGTNAQQLTGMSSQMTFTLPISDCGCFMVGEIHAGNMLPPMAKEPRYGVIVWYENKETAKVAAKAATDAHWADDTAVCAKCGVETKGEVAWVNGEEWCHSCADKEHPDLRSPKIAACTERQCEKNT